MMFALVAAVLLAAPLAQAPDPPASPEPAPAAPEAPPTTAPSVPSSTEPAPAAPTDPTDPAVPSEPAPWAPPDPAPAVPVPSPVPSPVPPPVPAKEPGFFDDGQPGAYLKWYGAEYVGVVALGALALTGVTSSVEPLPASIGPSFSLDEPDLDLLFDPRLDDVIGAPILQEKVPSEALVVAVVTAILGDAAVDLAIRKDLHRTHAIVLGGAEAVVGAAVVTEAFKLGFGRLRPDFRERYVRAACANVVDKPDELDCTGVLDDGFVVERKELLDGMKSFFSGHASLSFAAASFVAMQIGSDYLWGKDAPDWARPVAGIAVGGLLAGAGYISATRVEDNRHHLEDVVVGASVGVASGVAAYLVHFDVDGEARRRWSVDVAPMALPEGIGVSVTGDL